MECDESGGVENDMTLHPCSKNTGYRTVPPPKLLLQQLASGLARWYDETLRALPRLPNCGGVGGKLWKPQAFSQQ
jgi:hypothetical protein